MTKSQFVATQVWTSLIKTFVANCPRGKHRRYFRLIDSSFTGREAVDFLLGAIPKILQNGRVITREHCSKLLQKFLEENHFYRYDGKGVFKDNGSLYW